ncbi:MAG: HAD family phosphatase [Parachlamydiaceae bacterium]|nr:HAD family phosphatase [Parachlamydiaceae bacterium]
MNWIKRYQLFLFDFDGLLVNTEELHYQAYIKMCSDRGYHLPWNFHRYSEAAHHSATGLREQIYAEFPELHSEESNWDILYEEKKKAFLNYLQSGATQLMPGVTELLKALEEANIKRCVVTHSALPLIQTIRAQNAILDTIPNWITREDYSHPKPDPECYQIAINRFANENDQIIGFEDSPRGLNALLGTRAIPVLVCPPDYPYLNQVRKPHIKYFPSFTSIKDNNHP